MLEERVQYGQFEQQSGDNLRGQFEGAIWAAECGNFEGRI